MTGMCSLLVGIVKRRKKSIVTVQSDEINLLSSRVGRDNTPLPIVKGRIKANQSNQYKLRFDFLIRSTRWWCDACRTYCQLTYWPEKTWCKWKQTVWKDLSSKILVIEFNNCLSKRKVFQKNWGKLTLNACEWIEFNIT